MMKRWVGVAAVACGVVMLVAGCASGYGIENGYGVVPPAVIFSNTKAGSYTEQNLEYLKRPYMVLGHAEGDAHAINVMFVCAVGDASCQTAEENALSKFADADALINRTFSVKHFSVMSVFNKVTNHVSGDAIKYLDDGKSVK